MTLIASAEPRPDHDWKWSEFGNWPQARRDAVFSDWFDRTYLDVSIAGDSRCPLQIQRFDHRDDAQQALYGIGMSDVKPVGRYPGGSKGVLVGFPVEQCYEPTSEEDMKFVWLVADVRASNGKLLDTVRFRYRIELRESFVDWWLF